MSNKEFTTIWKQYEPLIQAIVALFHPFVEVAIHDLKKGKIVAIYHNISRRQVGDPSPLKELQIDTKEFPDYFSPYYKDNWDGRPLKCTSITMRNQKGVPVGLICLNVDVNFFKEGHDLLKTFLKLKEEGENPIEIFGSQCEEQTEMIIEQFLENNQLSLFHLNRNQKRDLVQHLYQKGIFNFKNAAPLIARKLGISRATIYNHIKLIGG